MRREVVSVMRRSDCQVIWKCSWRFGRPFGSGSSGWGKLGEGEGGGNDRSGGGRSGSGISRELNLCGGKNEADLKSPLRLGRLIVPFQISLGECNAGVEANISAVELRPY